MQHLLLLALALIGKADIFKANLLAKALQDMCALLLLHVILRIHEFEDIFAGSQRLLKAVVKERELPHRIVQRKHRDEKRDERPRRHAAVNDALPPQIAAATQFPPIPSASIKGELIACTLTDFRFA